MTSEEIPDEIHQAVSALLEMKTQYADMIAKYEAVMQAIGCGCLTHEGRVLNKYEIVDKKIIYTDPTYPISELRELLEDAPQFLELPAEIQEKVKKIRSEKYDIN